MASQSEENVPTFPKGFFFPGGHRWLPLKLWLLNLAKRTNLELRRFSHNSNFKFRSAGERFMQTQGHWRRNSGYFRNVNNIFLLVDLGQNWLNTTDLFLSKVKGLFKNLKINGPSFRLFESLQKSWKSFMESEDLIIVRRKWGLLQW